MSDQPVSPTPLFDDDGKTRMQRFMTATITSAFLITGLTALLMHSAAPAGGWAVAFGIGAMIGLWMSPLAGVVFGNGFHEFANSRDKLMSDGAAH